MKNYPNLFYCIALVFVGSFYFDDAEYTSADSISQISSVQEYGIINDAIQTQHTQVVWLWSIDEIIFIAKHSRYTYATPLVRSDKEVPYGEEKAGPLWVPAKKDPEKYTA